MRARVLAIVKRVRVFLLYFFPPFVVLPSSRRRSRTSIHTARKHSRYVPTNSNQVCFTIGLFAAGSWAASKMADVLPTPIFYSALHSILFPYSSRRAPRPAANHLQTFHLYSMLSKAKNKFLLEPTPVNPIYFRYGSIGICITRLFVILNIVVRNEWKFMDTLFRACPFENQINAMIWRYANDMIERYVLLDIF